MHLFHKICNRVGTRRSACLCSTIISHRSRKTFRTLLYVCIKLSCILLCTRQTQFLDSLPKHAHFAVGSPKKLLHPALRVNVTHFGNRCNKSVCVHVTNGTERIHSKNEAASSTRNTPVRPTNKDAEKRPMPFILEENDTLYILPDACILSPKTSKNRCLEQS